MVIQVKSKKSKACLLDAVRQVKSINPFPKLGFPFKRYSTELAAKLHFYVLIQIKRTYVCPACERQRHGHITS
jgi:hypothetical protein